MTQGCLSLTLLSLGSLYRADVKVDESVYQEDKRSNSIYDIPDVFTFIDNRPEDVFFKRLRPNLTGRQSLIKESLWSHSSSLAEVLPYRISGVPSLNDPL